MQTDRSPVSYLYLSRRLLTGVVQQDEASLARSNWSVNVSPVPAVGVSRERKPPDYDNLYDLAARSTEATSDHTGSIDSPWGIYLHGEMDMHFGVFPPHQGWDGNVACYRGESETADGQPVYVACSDRGRTSLAGVQQVTPRSGTRPAWTASICFSIPFERTATPR
jgi:hypothetical protein